MPLSNKLQALRKQHNLTQEELADQLNVSRQALSKWELGASTPEAEKIVQLSEYFKVSTDYLLKDNIETLETTKKRLSSPRLTIVISTAINLIGLIVLLFFYWEYYYFGFIIQIIGLVTFELLISRQPKSEHALTRSIFYGINCWIVLFGPYVLIFQSIEKYLVYFIPIYNEISQKILMYGGYIFVCLIISSLIYIRYKKKHS